jgi:hypothetical protein
MKPLIPTRLHTAEGYTPLRQSEPAGQRITFGVVLLFALLAVPFVTGVLGSVAAS